MAGAQVNKMRVLALYREMLREAGKFTGFNYRTYALRRVKDAFQEHRSESDADKISECIMKAENNLQIMRRQAAISQLYKDPKLIIETPGAKAS